MKKIALTLLMSALLFSCGQKNTLTSIDNNDDQISIKFNANGGTFKDGTSEKTVKYKKGELPKKEDVGVPEKAAEGGTYTFEKWSPNFSVALVDMTYKASYTYTGKAFTVNWKNGSEIIETDTDVPYNSAPTFDGTVVAETGFRFDHWEDDQGNQLHAVTANIDYHAVFIPDPAAYYDYEITCANCAVKVKIGDKDIVYTHYAAQAVAGEKVTVTFCPLVDSKYLLPNNIDIKVGGIAMPPEDYGYDNTTGELWFNATGDDITIMASATSVRPTLHLIYASPLESSNEEREVAIKAVIPTIGGVATFDWGDGSAPTTGEVGTHTYTTPNPCVVTIYGPVSKVDLAGSDGLLAPGNIDFTQVIFDYGKYYEEDPGIDQWAYANCTRLQEVTLPNTPIPLTEESGGEIQADAFTNCTSLKSFKLPQSIVSVSPLAFRGCSALRDIFVHPNNPKYTSRDDSKKEANVIIEKRAKPDDIVTLVRGTGNMKFSNFDGADDKGKVIIGANAFDGVAALTDVKLDGTIKEISSGAFTNCQNLTTISRDETATCDTYASSMCIGCPSLAHVDFTGIKSIGESAFQGCTNLQQITLPQCLTSIGPNAFNTDSLKFVDLTRIGEPEEEGGAYNIPSKLIDDTSFKLDSGVTFLTPSGEENTPEGNARLVYEGFAIKDNLFKVYSDKKRSKLIAWGQVRIEPGEGVARKIAFRATIQDKGLKFRCLYNAGNPHDDFDLLNHYIEFKNGVADFEYTYNSITDEPTYYTFAFYAENLKGPYGDWNYTLGDVTFNDENGQPYGDANSQITYFYNPQPFRVTGFAEIHPFYPQHAFAGMTSLESVTCPVDSVASSSLSEGLFKGDTNLKKFTIPRGMTAIGYHSFDGCTSLEKVGLNAELALALESSFANTKISSICFGSKFYVIRDKAFDHCANLKTIDISNCDDFVQLEKENRDPGSLGDGLSQDLRILVPAEKLQQYQESAAWSKYNLIGV